MNTDCTDYTDKGADTGISVLSVLSVFVLNDHGIGDFYSLMRGFYRTRIARIKRTLSNDELRILNYDSVMRKGLNTEAILNS